MQGPMQAALEKAKLNLAISRSQRSEDRQAQEPQFSAEQPAPAKKPRKKPVSVQKEKFTAEFKRKAVALYQSSGDAPKTAKDLNIPAGTLYTWIYRVEHGGKLHDSIGMEPWMGERYINPNPQKNPTGQHAVSWKDKLDAERTPLPIGDATVIEAGPTPEKIKAQIEAEAAARSRSPLDIAAANMRAESERKSTLWPNGAAGGGGSISSFSTSVGSGSTHVGRGQTAAIADGPCDARKEPGYAIENRLRAENEALRQIIRGFYALLHLT